MDRQAALARIDACLALLLRTQRSRRSERERALRSGVWLSPAALAFLADLERRGPERVTQLADRAGVELTRASRELHAMAANGLVRLDREVTDRRAVVVELTEGGRRQWDAYRGASRDLLAGIVGDWDDTTVEAFAELFDRFVQAAASSGRDEAGTGL